MVKNKQNTKLTQPIVKGVCCSIQQKVWQNRERKSRKGKEADMSGPGRAHEASTWVVMRWVEQSWAT